MPPIARRQDDADGRPPPSDAEREARLAQAAGDDLEHLLRRTRDHRQHQDGESERAEDRALPAADDEQTEDEDADDDRRHAVQDVEHDPKADRDPWAGVLGHEDRDEDAARDRHHHRHADDEGAAHERVGNPPRLTEERARLGEEVEAQLADAPVDHRPEHEPEDGDRHHRASDGESGEHLLGDPAATQAAGPGRDVVPVVVGHRCHQYALRARSNLVTITCATTLVTSEMTIRITPR